MLSAGKVAAATLVSSLALLASPLLLAPVSRPAAVASQVSGAVRAGIEATARPCGTALSKPKVDQVLLLWEENHSYASVIGSADAPEINWLAAHCGLATDYKAVTHPSLPNYMSMTSGLSYAYPPWQGDCDPVGRCTTRAPSIFSELVAAGKQWRAYAESMVSNCSLATYGAYAARHNPAVYYLSVRAQCRAWDLPLGTTRRGALQQALASGPKVALSTVTPDVYDDMHSGSVAEADRWLRAWVPEILASPSYRSGHLAVVIAWDEGFGSGNVPSSAPLIVMSAYTHPGTRVSLPLNDFSVLRSISELTGVQPLGEAAKATSFVAAFNL